MYPKKRIKPPRPPEKRRDANKRRALEKARKTQPKKRIKKIDLVRSHKKFSDNPFFGGLGSKQNSFLKKVGSPGGSIEWKSVLKIFSSQSTAIGSIAGLVSKGFWFEIPNMPEDVFREINRQRQSRIASSERERSRETDVGSLVKDKLAEFGLGAGPHWDAVTTHVLDELRIKGVQDMAEKTRLGVEIVGKISSKEELLEIISAYKRRVKLINARSRKNF